MYRALMTESSMNIGGQELHILMLMEGLKRYGFDSVLVARPGSKILDEAVRRGLRHYALRMRGSIDPAAVLRLARFIKKEKIDIVNTFGSKDGWSAGLAARLTGRKVVRSRRIATPIRTGLFSYIVYNCLCDMVVTSSEFIRAGMTKNWSSPKRAVVVPTGVDMTKFNPAVERGVLRRQFGITGKTSLVGFVSIVRGDKGPDVFVRAAELVLDKTEDVTFVIVGDGNMLPVIRDMVSASRHKDNIFITGYRHDIPQVMADLDIFVLPAVIPEGVPQVVLQAHSTKTPVIASDVGGVRESAIHGKTAVCVPPGDAPALARAIIDLLNDGERASALAEEGYRLVARDYTVEKMLDRIAKLYLETIQARTP